MYSDKKQQVADCENYPYVIASLSSQIYRLKQQHIKEVQDLKGQFNVDLEKTKNDLEFKLQEAEYEKKHAIAGLHFQFKTSLTWRIGSFILNIIKIFRNFLYSPIKFIANSDYRFKDIERRPRKQIIKYPEQKPFNALVTQVKKTETSFAIEKGKPIILGIFDTFTQSCFKPEFNILTPTPETWQELLHAYPVDALFFESAWRGNDDAWRYQIGKYNNQENKKLKELIAALKSRNIPVFYWNKEDPVHFDHFLVAAKLVDYVFTSDADCIPKYVKEVGHHNVFSLPFAAQEKIHNPIRVGARTGNVCFAGTYYNERYPDRKTDLDIILRPSMDFGLDIYDRNLDRTDKMADQLRFPKIFSSSVKGKLEYNQMVEAYKKYKVFLNVNSVRKSPTMFARRVYELLACGTPVISTYSKGIVDILGEDTVLITESETDTRKHLSKLLTDEHYWWRKSLEGMRIVHGSHRYYHRVKYICEKTGLQFKERKPISFLVITEINSKEQALSIAEMLKRQTYQHFELLFVMKAAISLAAEEKEIISKVLPNKKVEFININTLEKDAEYLKSYISPYLAVMDVGCYYGKHYLYDYSNAIIYSGAKKLGKKSYFSTNASNKLTLHNKGCEFNYMADVPTGSLVIDKSIINQDAIAALFKQDSYYDFEINILSIDPFNFILGGRSADNKNNIFIEI